MDSYTGAEITKLSEELNSYIGLEAGFKQQLYISSIEFGKLRTYKKNGMWVVHTKNTRKEFANISELAKFINNFSR